jgi:hypothetical protein
MSRRHGEAAQPVFPHAGKTTEGAVPNGVQPRASTEMQCRASGKEAPVSADYLVSRLPVDYQRNGAYTLTEFADNREGVTPQSPTLTFNLESWYYR